jgi:hypothetical protein
MPSRCDRQEGDDQADCAEWQAGDERRGHRDSESCDGFAKEAGLEGSMHMG